jgi:hypothetical protein
MVVMTPNRRSGFVAQVRLRTIPRHRPARHSVGHRSADMAGTAVQHTDTNRLPSARARSRPANHHTLRSIAWAGYGATVSSPPPSGPVPPMWLPPVVLMVVFTDMVQPPHAPAVAQQTPGCEDTHRGTSVVIRAIMIHHAWPHFVASSAAPPLSRLACSSEWLEPLHR